MIIVHNLEPFTQEDNGKHVSWGLKSLSVISEHRNSIYCFADLEKIIVTTGDLKQSYDVIGPIFFQVSNKGLFSSKLGELKKLYEMQIQEKRKSGQIEESYLHIDWGVLIGEWSAGQTDFEAAFFIAVQELKKRAIMLNADAIVAMRQDIDLDTNGFQYFYLQMYGTAVRFRDDS